MYEWLSLVNWKRILCLYLTYCFENDDTFWTQSKNYKIHFEYKTTIKLTHTLTSVRACINPSVFFHIILISLLLCYFLSVPYDMTTSSVSTYHSSEFSMKPHLVLKPLYYFDTANSKFIIIFHTHLNIFNILWYYVSIPLVLPIYTSIYLHINIARLFFSSLSCPKAKNVFY